MKASLFPRNTDYKIIQLNIVRRLKIQALRWQEIPNIKTKTPWEVLV